MQKLLFINACVRQHSRTLYLCKEYLKTLKNCEITEEDLKTTPLKPLTQEALLLREENKTPESLRLLAERFSRADEIVIAAPYWDCSFPAILKLYIENICINGITFSYDKEGKPKKLCRAKSLTYITTAGGYLKEANSVRLYFEELCELFLIPRFNFYAAQELDVFPEKEGEILKNSLLEIIK